MQKPFQIVRFVSQVRTGNISADGQNHGDEINFKGVDREFHRIHGPGDPRVEGSGNCFQKTVQGFYCSPLFQYRVNAFCPVALKNQSEHGKSGAEENGTPCTGQVSKTAVKSEDHDRTRAAEPDCAHDRCKHIDVIQLCEKDGNDQEKEGNAYGGETQIQQVFFLRKTPFEHRQHHVLHQSRRRIENTAVVRGNQQHDHQEAEQPEHSHREDFADHGRHHHLLIKRAVLLELVTSFGSVAERVSHRIEIRGVEVLLLRHGGLEHFRCHRGGDFAYFRKHLLPDGRIGHGFLQDFCRKTLPDSRIGDSEPVVRIGEMGTCHEGDDDDRQQEDHDPCHAVPPCAEHAGHFLFMRGSSGSAGVIADPAGPVQDGAEKCDDQSEYVEIPQL